VANRIGVAEPILSICIPTLNRAELLDDALQGLRPEVVSLGDTVEVVVSDNGSSDATRDVLQRHSDWIRWDGIDRTISFTENMLRVTCDLARGQFVWLVGDDDLVIRGSIERVVKSLNKLPDVAYHYLNFGWLQISQRKRIIQELDSTPPDSPLRGVWQCDEFGTRLLSRIEDLAFLPGKNPSALFSGMFCFAAHRELFISARQWLRPSEYFDGSSDVLDDCFPHPMITLPPMAGKPIVYIGQPCLLQGIGGQATNTVDYELKNMILGNYQLLTWLEGTEFAKDATERLWESYYEMAGRLFYRMLNAPDQNKGREIVLDTVIPGIASQYGFWRALMSEAELTFERDEEARIIVRLVEPLLEWAPSSRVGLWGVQGRGSRAVQLSPLLASRLVWAGDLDPRIEGEILQGTPLVVTSPETLRDANLDILIIGTRSDVVPNVVFQASPLLRAGAIVASVKGLETTGNSGERTAL